MAFYVYDRPVCGRSIFHGRTSIVRALHTGLGQRRSFCVCGGPKLGKTSVLWETGQRIHRDWTRRLQGSKVVPVFVDLRQLATLTPQALVTAIWNALLQAIRDPRVIGGSHITLPDFKIGKQDNPWEVFHREITSLWRQLEGTRSWCEYALLIDNADGLLQHAMRQSLDFVARMTCSGESWAPSSLIITAERPLREHLLDTASPLRFVRPLFLSPLSDAEARALVKVGIREMDDGRIEELINTVGKHPYLLQRFLSEVEIHGMGASIDDILRTTSSEILTFFEHLWMGFDMNRGITYRGAYAAPEHALMQLLIDLPAGNTVSRAETELGIKPMREYAEFLEYYGVAEKHIHGDQIEYRAQFKLWNNWYSERVMQ